MRRITSVVVSVSILLLVVFVATVGAAPPVFPEVIPLPIGFEPEGIVVGRGTDFYVGSLAGGAIYKGDLRTGAGDLLVQPQEGRVAVGLAYDARTDYLYVAGDGAGAAYVYDGTTGAEIAVIQLTDPGSFVNDVIVTRTAAYFTDSFRPYLYKVPLWSSGEPLGTATELELTGDFTFVPGSFNANGIDATPNGKWLIVVNSTTGELYRVDPETGVATLIDLGGGSVPAGDGILLDGKTLYVVQNQLEQIAVIELAPNLLSGMIVDTITDAEVGGLFRVPTTIDDFGNALYAVNARFGVAMPSEAEYEVVRVPKP